VALIGEKIILRKLEGKTPLGRPNPRREIILQPISRKQDLGCKMY
jgi:hypothetical protein